MSLLIDPNDLDNLQSLCHDERCPIDVLGTVTNDTRLVTYNDDSAGINLPMATVFATGRTIQLAATPCIPDPTVPVRPQGLELTAACHQILSHPAVADKSFLITISDRSVGGLTARDQLVGPWQVAVADCAVTLADYRNVHGRAFGLGERPALAVFDPAAAARIAISEALTNLAAARIGALTNVKMSLNWMADATNAVRARRIGSGRTGHLR